MLTYMSGADVTDSVDTLRTDAQRKGGLAQVPSALALLQVSFPSQHSAGVFSRSSSNVWSALTKWGAQSLHAAHASPKSRSAAPDGHLGGLQI